MKKMLSLACAFLMGVSCTAFPVNAESVPSAELLELREELRDYIKENNIKASANFSETNYSPEVYQVVLIDYRETDTEVPEQILSFLKENGIDSSLVDFEFLDTEEPVIIKGDASGNGSVDIIDVIIANRAIQGVDTLTDEQLEAIDLNKNGKPDSDDAVTLLKYIVGLIDSLN